MKRSTRIKLIQLLILIAFWISLIILFGGEEPATGEPIEVVEYNYIPDILPDLPEAPVERINITEREYDLLIQVTYHEARGESLEGQKEVVRVILNRVESEHFPNNIEEVIFQDRQFCSAPLIDNTNLKFEYLGSLKKAVDTVIREEGNDGALYFMNPIHAGQVSRGWFSRLEHVKTVGNHEFYK